MKYPYLCSLVRRKESIETCSGNCNHVDGKQYKINNDVYTCVKVLKSEPFPIWSNRVNKIMDQ